VLVTQDYEGNPDFFYPTPRSEIIYTRDNRPLDAAHAEVTLAEIPFIRLRDGLPARLLGGQAGFAETIDLAHRANQPPELVIDRVARELVANGIRFSVPPSLFAFYLWVIQRSVLEEKPLPKPDKINRFVYAAEFQRYYEDTVGDSHDTEKTDVAMKEGMKLRFFQEKISRINSTLEGELGEHLARSFRIRKRGRRGKSDYSVDLNATQIRINLGEVHD
jgi:hypothetical protein